MFKQVFIVSCAALLLAGAPQYVKLLGETGATGSSGEAADHSRNLQANRLEKLPDSTQASYVSGARTVAIPMDNSGHFTASFHMNGRTVRGVIDTGATFVAINEATARSIGLRLAASDFVHGVRTANGTTHAAMVNVDRMEIGNIRVANVETFVLKDKALSGTLVGMSFMSKLASYQVKGRTLELVE